MIIWLFSVGLRKFFIHTIGSFFILFLPCIKRNICSHVKRTLMCLPVYVGGNNLCFPPFPRNASVPSKHRLSGNLYLVLRSVIAMGLQAACLSPHGRRFFSLIETVNKEGIVRASAFLYASPNHLPLLVICSGIWSVCHMTVTQLSSAKNFVSRNPTPELNGFLEPCIFFFFFLPNLST